MTTNQTPLTEITESREQRLAIWRGQLDLCRQAGRADLVAICQEAIDGLEYGGETIRWEDDDEQPR